ncbi:MAG: hypothetical protein IIA02_07465 [Proteobacteria bacterium]|uniref:hypothetical protein n=1 Tax=Aquabacterium sp. TaxID=1872578 RepID=UPI0035C6C134|nr:hypothetical protein [Pseudomonadota bacterium]
MPHAQPTPRRPRLWLTAALWGLSLSAIAGNAQAAMLGYTSGSSFDAAIASSSYQANTLVDFEAAGHPLGTAPWRATGILAAGGAPQTVANSGLWTTSGVSFLGGADIGNLGQFSSGDSLTFQLTQPTHAFGLYVITGGDVIEGDLSLSANGLTVNNGPQSQALSDGQGSHAHFLGLRADAFNDGFTTVSLTSNGGFFFVFAVDDVRSAALSAVPEPTGALLGLLGAIGTFAATRPRARRPHGTAAGTPHTH